MSISSHSHFFFPTLETSGQQLGASGPFVTVHEQRHSSTQDIASNTKSALSVSTMERAMLFIKLVREELEPTLYGEFREVIMNEFLKPEQDPTSIVAAVEKMKKLLQGHSRLLGEFDVFLGRERSSSSSGDSTLGTKNVTNSDFNDSDTNDKKRFDGSLDLGNNSELYESIDRPNKKARVRKATKHDAAMPPMNQYMSSFDDGQSLSSQMYKSDSFMDSTSSMVDHTQINVLPDQVESSEMENYPNDDTDQQLLTRTYISDIRNRLQDAPATMAYFMEILRQYTMQQNTYGVNIAFYRISRLFTPYYKVDLFSNQSTRPHEFFYLPRFCDRIYCTA